MRVFPVYCTSVLVTCILLYLQKKSREESEGTESAVEILENHPYTDGPHGSGQYTYKVVPSFFHTCKLVIAYDNLEFHSTANYHELFRTLTKNSRTLAPSYQKHSFVIVDRQFTQIISCSPDTSQYTSVVCAVTTTL